MVSPAAGRVTERANAKFPLLCPVCREREAILRYSKKDTPYIVCPCGIRAFIWADRARLLILKRVKDYADAKKHRKLEEYKISQKEGM